MDIGIKYVDDTDAFASLSARLILKEYGNDSSSWELESLWKTLEEDQIALDDLVKVKIASFLALKENPMALWEINTFQNTVLAASNIYPIPGITQEATPYDIGWGVLEITDYLLNINKIPEGRVIKWGTEVESYIVSSLKYNGWFIAPYPIGFCQETLDSVNKNIGVKPKLLFEWDKIKDKDLSTLEIPQDDEIGVQLNRLRNYRVYLKIKYQTFLQHKQDLGFTTD